MGEQLKKKKSKSFIKTHSTTIYLEKTLAIIGTRWKCEDVRLVMTKSSHVERTVFI